MGHESYSEIGITTDVFGATPHQLIEMLLDKCAEHIQASKNNIIQNKVTQKCEAISKALDIINYLRVSLNFDNPQAKKMSEHLNNVYNRIEHQLVKANLYGSVDFLDEAGRLLDMLRLPWKSMKS